MRCLAPVAPTLRRCVHSSVPEKIVIPGIKIRTREYPRVARERNRFAAILRFAKAIPEPPPVIHPITQTILPITRSTCHTCGRQFIARPRPPNYEPNPKKKYCHKMCQTSRPKRFEMWLEEQIMRVLKKAHGVNRKDGKLEFRCISTDIIEDFVYRHHGKMFGDDIPLHLSERIRQAARRLVGIPGRSGKEWQAIALDAVPGAEGPMENRYVRRTYAPDRGNILLGLVRADPFQHQSMKELTPEEAGLVKPTMEEGVVRVGDRILKDLPEWEGQYWWDETGKIRPASDTRRPRSNLHVPQRQAMTGDQLLDGKWAREQSLKLERSKKKEAGWANLLRQNRQTIDLLAKQRNEEFGL